MNAEKHILMKLIDFLSNQTKTTLEALTQNMDHNQTTLLRGEFMTYARIQAKIKEYVEEVKQMEKKNDE